jgi:hypothetical protein
MCGVAAAAVNRRRGGELASACAAIAWRAKFGKWRQTAKKKGRQRRPETGHPKTDLAQASGRRHISSALVQSGRAPVTRRIEHRP